MSRANNERCSTFMHRTPGLKGIAVSNPYGLSVIKGACDQIGLPTATSALFALCLAVTTTDAPRAEIEGVETLLASVFALAAGQVCAQQKTNCAPLLVPCCIQPRLF